MASEQTFECPNCKGKGTVKIPYMALVWSAVNPYQIRMGDAKCMCCDNGVTVQITERE